MHGKLSVVCREYLNVVRSVCGVKAGPHQLLAVNNQPAATNKRCKKKNYF
jgi:hypothetical protein